MRYDHPVLAPPKRRRKQRHPVSQKVRRAWHREIQNCRRDPVRFIEYVFNIKLDPVQIEWIRFWMAHRKTVLHGAVGVGKTAIMRGMVLWFVGTNPNVQIIWLSATQRQPKKHLSLIASLIEDVGVRSRLHHVFPRMTPGKVWRSSEITVDREVSPTEADYTISTYGAYADSLLGSRATILIVDDLCNFTNTLTEDGRSKMIEWFATVLSRLTRPGYRMMVMGNYWHANDALMDLRLNKGFKYMKTPAYVLADDGHPDEASNRIPTAPRAMSLEVIEEKIQELGPRKAAQMLRCEKPDLNLGRFEEIFIEAALTAGIGMPFCPPRVFYPCFTGVDLGHRGAPGADRTAMTTAILRPDGRKQIIDVRSGTWKSHEITANLRELRIRYNSTIGVENNGAQKMVMDMITDATAIPLLDHNTNMFNKRDIGNGVEGLARSLSASEWVFPCPPRPKNAARGLDDEDGVRGQPEPELQALIAEALCFDPSKPREHTGDRLMSWWILSETIRKSALAAYDQAVLPAGDVPDLDLFSR